LIKLKNEDAHTCKSKNTIRFVCIPRQVVAESENFDSTKQTIATNHPSRVSGSKKSISKSRLENAAMKKTDNGTPAKTITVSI